MGFFSDLKEDLSQAVNELMPAGETPSDEMPAEEIPANEISVEEAAATAADAVSSDVELTAQGVSLEEMLKNIDDVQVPEFMDEMPEQAEAEAAVTEALAEPEAAMYESGAAEETPEALAEPEAAMDESEAAEEMPEPAPETAEEISEPAPETAEEPLPEPGMAEEAAVEPEPAIPETEEMEQQTIEEYKGEEKMDSFANREAIDETAVITSGMQITGDIVSEGSVDVIGSVNGNIDVLGKLNITGHINGNSKAAEIYAEGKINGEVVSEGAVKIGSSSVIIGNISATSAAIAGAVKGDIDVRGPVILDSSAIVMGNIKSKSVQINNGAVIEGMCSQCYADVSPTAFFDDYKPEEKPAKKAK